jgi:hypothetical protein
MNNITNTTTKTTSSTTISTDGIDCGIRCCIRSFSKIVNWKQGTNIKQTNTAQGYCLLLILREQYRE